MDAVRAKYVELGRRRDDLTERIGDIMEALEQAEYADEYVAVADDVENDIPEELFLWCKRDPAAARAEVHMLERECDACQSQLDAIKAEHPAAAGPWHTVGGFPKFTNFAIGGIAGSAHPPRF